jgi:acetyl esterase/lipase
MPRSSRLGIVAGFMLAIAAAPAAANVPASFTKVNTVRIPSLANRADGTLTTRITFTEATATAAASTGNTIGLGTGFYFRLRTCVAYHLNGATPTSSCAERYVDTRASTATLYTYAPAVTLSGQPRATTQPWGYFTAYTEVLYLNAQSWPVSAHSWPDNGLQGAGIAVAAQGKTGGALPVNATVKLDGAFTSAIDSGQPDSICTAAVSGPDGSPLPAGVSASNPAFAGAPAPYEVGVPTGAYAGQPTRGIMLIIHGGAWVATGAGVVKSMRPDADRWRARGWTTVNFSYRACGQSAADVLWFYDRTRAAVGAAMKMCALGTSAGGHLALLLGSFRPDLYCAVSQAGPTDLNKIKDEVAYDPASGLHNQTSGGRWVHNLGAAAFGEENLTWFSPAALAYGSLSRVRVLQAFSADDQLVPYAQAADLANAMRATNPAAYVDDLQLAIGGVAFAHGAVTQAALDDFHSHETQLVAPAGALTAGTAFGL